MVFGRPAQMQRPEEPEPEPTSVVYTGENGAMLTGWARDPALLPRFQPASKREGTPARVLLFSEGEGSHVWEIVEKGDRLEKVQVGQNDDKLILHRKATTAKAVATLE